MAEDGRIETVGLAHSLEQAHDMSMSHVDEALPEREGRSLDELLADFEKRIILEALEKTGGIQSRAAQLLGINQRSLWHRTKKYQIDVQTIKKQQNM